MQNKSNVDWAWIKYHLELRGLTFGKIAAKHGVDKTCFTKLKTVPMPKNERILADYLDLEPWDLWPDRYDSAHNPNRTSPRYPGHKHFLNNTQNKLKINGKDNQTVTSLKSISEATE